MGFESFLMQVQGRTYWHACSYIRNDFWCIIPSFKSCSLSTFAERISSQTVIKSRRDTQLWLFLMSQEKPSQLPLQFHSKVTLKDHEKNTSTLLNTKNLPASVAEIHTTLKYSNAKTATTIGMSTEVSNSSLVVGMSLNENGTNAHAAPGMAQQPNSLRKPMAKR